MHLRRHHLMLVDRRDRVATILRHRHRRAVRGMDGKGMLQSATDLIKQYTK